MAWLTVESLCLHGRVLERGIQRPEALLLMEDQNFFLCPTLVVVVVVSPLAPVGA